MLATALRALWEPAWKHLVRDLMAGFLLAGAYLLARRAARGGHPRPGSRVRLGWLRPFNKHVLNPAVMAFSGRPGVFFGVVRHRGRSSGRIYSTPLAPLPVPGGFLFVTPYGPSADWCRNILAAGGCQIRWHGKNYSADRPELLTLREAAQFLPRAVLAVARLVGINTVLKVRSAYPDTSSIPGASSGRARKPSLS